MENKTFNLIINGVGGQGIITLLSLVDQTAMFAGYEVRSSELHGLSQRGGSVETHLRFGKKVNSPRIADGSADLMISLEMLEGLRIAMKSGKETKFLINEYLLPFPGSLPENQVKDGLGILYGSYLVPATVTCKEKLQNEVVAGVYLLGYAIKHGLLPLKKEFFQKALVEVVPQRYLELNQKAFELGYDS